MSIKKFFSIKLIKWVLTPVVLLLFWTIGTVMLAENNHGITILTYDGSRDNLKEVTFSELLIGDKIKAEFQAKQDNLGIVAIRFNTFGRINDDKLIFRIRPKGSMSWYYQNTYKVDQFQPDNFFTFGFPVIDNSKGRLYQFELESVAGDKGDAVAISPIDPVFLTKYEYTRQYLFANNQEIIPFVINKIVNQYSDIDFGINSFILLLPLIVYVYKVLLFDKFFSDNYFVSLLPVLLVLVVSFFAVTTNIIITSVILILSMISFVAYRFEGRIAFMFAMLFLSIGALVLFFNLKIPAEKLSIWAYWFLVIGTLMQVLEIKKIRRNLLSVENFLAKIYVIYLYEAGKRKAIFIKGFLFKSYLLFTKFLLKIKNFYSFKSKTKTGYFKIALKYFLTLALVSLVIFKFIYPEYIKHFLKNTYYNQIKMSSFYILISEPRYVHLGDKVVIKGDGFNLGIGKFVKVMSTNGEIIPDFTTNDTLILTVPLSWENGLVKVWLESVAEESNMTEINVIDRLGNYSWEDVLYFSQIKFLDKEAREVNEFRNFKPGRSVVGVILKFFL